MQGVQKIKIEFSKTGLIRYIGNIDMMNQIFMGIRRTNLPVVYTQGFNPRIKASFSPALSVGFESETEFVEIVLKRNVNPDEIKNSLKNKLPEGFKIISVEKKQSRRHRATEK